jgi:hypothetical protein
VLTNVKLDRHDLAAGDRGDRHQPAAIDLARTALDRLGPDITGNNDLPSIDLGTTSKRRAIVTAWHRAYYRADRLFARLLGNADHKASQQSAFDPPISDVGLVVNAVGTGAVNDSQARRRRRCLKTRSA